MLGRTITGTANQIGLTNGDGITGNPILALTSTIQVSGISFDSGSNTLNTYATGTFSPTLTGSTTNPTVGYASQVGRYTKIGNRVYVTVYIQVNSYTGGSGNLRISNLPFTTNASTGAVSRELMSIQNVTESAATFYYMVAPISAATDVTITGNRSATTSLNLPVGNGSATSIYNSTFSYEV